MSTNEIIRNFSIIAHIDHGKSTLADRLIHKCGGLTDREMKEQVLDSMDIERERGITIKAQTVRLNYTAKNGKDYILNIIDTPGHSDFGAEVERVLGMCDGVILLTDAAEGPMPQTKFVLGKALKQGLKPIVVINKIDRSDSRGSEVVDEVFDLFVALEASDEQLDFPILYASGRDGWCAKELEDPRENLHPLLDIVLDYVSPPKVELDKPFAMLVTLLDYDQFLGRCLVGRVEQGSADVNASVHAINLDNKVIEKGRMTKLFRFENNNKVPMDKVHAGDIICIAGLKEASVSDTISDPSVSIPLESTPIDPPTMSITITVNTSPLAGLDGTKVTSTMIRKRLMDEAETNVAITFMENSNKDSFEIGGRGELQLGVLIETMRREGFELSVSRPRVIFKEDDKGNKLEPFEDATIDVDEEYSSSVIDSMNKRKAEMLDMRSAGSDKTRIIFRVPSRGLIGYQNAFLTQTKGTGVLNRIFHSYDLHKGQFEGRRTGVLIATETGTAVAFALWKLQDRGPMFIDPQTKVYQGMIVGEHTRDNDLDINVLKGKQLTNVRASGTDEAVTLMTPKKMSLEQMIAYIKEDELLEVTPKNLRLRKRLLIPHERKRAS